MPSEDIIRLAFSPDGNYLAAATQDSLSFWGVQNCPCEQMQWFGEEMLTGLTFSPDNAKIISSNLDGTISFWDIASRRKFMHWYGEFEPSMSVALSPNRSLIAWTTGATQKVRVMDYISGLELPAVQGFDSGVITIAFSPNGKWLATGSFDGRVHLLNLESLEEDFKAEPSLLLQKAYARTNLNIQPATQSGSPLLSKQELTDTLGSEINSPLTLLASRDIDVSSSLQLNIFSRYKPLLRTTCLDPPVKAELNPFPITFTSPAEACQNYPPIDLRSVNGGRYSRNKDDWNNGVTVKAGDELYAHRLTF